MDVIYDFGSNNGDNIPYYLSKSDLVVAVEANPTLAAEIRRRFSEEVRERRLVVENCVLALSNSPSEVPFYIHKHSHVLSQFPRPHDAVIHDFDEIILPARQGSRIIEEYGPPLYVKVDIEHFDQDVLEEIFVKGIKPKFVSAESHDIAVFSALVSLGKYNMFKIVEGASVALKFRRHPIKTRRGNELYSFPHHSAGPFGEDIPGPWISANELFYLLSYVQLGWKDIHATFMEGGPVRSGAAVEVPLRFLLRAFARKLRTMMRRRWFDKLKLAFTQKRGVSGLVRSA